jgi:hypothetical protein
VTAKAGKEALRVRHGMAKVVVAREEARRLENDGGGSELGRGGHGEPAQGSGAPATSKTSKVRAREGEGVGEDGGARSCSRGGLKCREQQRRRKLRSLVHGGRDHEQQ